MRRLLIAGVAGLGVAFVARRAVRGCASRDFEQRIERMPAGSPARWMFTNIRAIRENTERILETLDGRATAAEEERTKVAA